MTESVILVADDEPNIQVLLETWLETLGCRVVSVEDGEMAVTKARELLPDLILMDGMMPKLNGFEACRELKGSDETRHIPIIFLTVQGELKDLVQGLELGAHGYMTKPFRPRELLARVSSALRIKNVQDRLRTHSQEITTRWNWMEGVVQSLPFGLLVVDLSSGELIHANPTLLNFLGLDTPPEGLLARLSFSSAEVLAEGADFDALTEIHLGEQALGKFRVRACDFSQEQRLGRQVLIDLES